MKNQRVDLVNEDNGLVIEIRERFLVALIAQFGFSDFLKKDSEKVFLMAGEPHMELEKFLSQKDFFRRVDFREGLAGGIGDLDDRILRLSLEQFDRLYPLED